MPWLQFETLCYTYLDLLLYQGLGFRDITPIMKNNMDKWNMKWKLGLNSGLAGWYTEHSRIPEFLLRVMQDF